VDPIRFGLGLRALRRRRRWRQEDLAARAGVSRGAVARAERGGADRLTVRTLSRIVAPLGARVDVRLLWQGELLDRLLDGDHAALVDAMLRLLRAAGWEVVTEVTFNEYGERGSIDILAFHAMTGSLLVVEVKSVVPDLQATLVTLDRKARLAGRIARERGWVPSGVSRLLVLPEERTARRRVALHAAIFEAALPMRNVAVRRWLRRPSVPMAGLLFLSNVTDTSARHRVPGDARTRHARTRRSGAGRSGQLSA